MKVSKTGRFSLWILATCIFASSALLLSLTGCGGATSMASPQTYGNPASRATVSTNDTTRADVPPGAADGQKDSDSSPAPADSAASSVDTRDEHAANEPRHPSRKTPPESFENGNQATRVNEDAARYVMQVDNIDSASAVDDDIWRLFDLAEEYYSMGVIANREASWEEAQYYFENCLKIMANLDVDEADTTMTPEAVKYTTILDNVISDYRVTLRSLGRLEQDVAPSVIVERFGDLERKLGLDSMRIYEEETIPVTYDLPVVMNDRVKKSVIYFQTVAKDAFRKYLTRSNKYVPMFREILAEYGIPQDLIYLSLVESGYNPNAYSWARAMGLWQFISSTGRMYGLNRNWWIDERKDPVKSTHAAARFLKDLYERFGDWELAMAAYNGGPGRVSSSIKKQGTIDFWKLRLRRQTMDYVPLIYAAAIIAKDPEKYGFDDIEHEDEVVWDEVVIDRCLDLKVVASELGCSYKHLKSLNPELLRQYTPPNVKNYKLKIPVGKKRTFLAAYDGMPSPKETSWVQHKIKRGETVSTIASKYGVSQYAIFAANNLSRRSKIYAGKKLIVPVPLDREYNNSSKQDRTYQADNSIYVVRSGDTMWDIARAFGTTVDQLRRINYIERGSRIYVGQKLKIPSSATKLKNQNRTKPSKTYASSSKSGSGSTPESGGKSSGGTYKVRSGDTLWDIARSLGTTTSKLRNLNGLGRSSRIYPGQVLQVPGKGGSDYVVHKVRRGDTLSKIAKKYRTTISHILANNGLTDPDALKVGEKLRIYVK